MQHMSGVFIVIAGFGVIQTSVKFIIATASSDFSLLAVLTSYKKTKQMAAVLTAKDS